MPCRFLQYGQTRAALGIFIAQYLHIFSAMIDLPKIYKPDISGSSGSP
jgi:hypothetical protein